MPTAVLLSGGLDSAVLLAEEASRGEVQPIYVAAGLAWEGPERAAAEAFLAGSSLGGHVRPLVSLSVDMRDVYDATHWAIAGRPPGYRTPDEDVYLPGRNIILLAKAGVYCAAAAIDRLVLGTLAHNPFPDATPEFRAAMAGALSLGLAHGLQIDAPYANFSKADVIRRGASLGVRFALTLSCMSGTGLRVDGDGSVSGTGFRAHGNGNLSPHCGVCSKCRERHDAFVEAGVADPTEYVARRNVEPRT
jgi:7-cyano-7-deazaguanine synthase